ncbi:putative cyclin-dependent serine/threonine-protein kinase DDB_G0272797/DDB_G0274007 [Mya arenaria]|uniref:putative cyclin-dependent serine/threonine-protein kinase DDB_G0272797/DDB_G0274007 n=1 Tax=Mya arenaria TaxID=6604 RepID=UPI0022E74DBE|nr:putative cyclin-dependent serine/threonine-protein kinase DDB_G0272797/DDB_G0274007 [Mya arenaria]
MGQANGSYGIYFVEEDNVLRPNNSEQDEQIARYMQEELNHERQRQEDQDRLHLEELIRADREEQEQQDRMFALTVQEMAQRGGQHGRNRGWGGFPYQNRGHEPRGLGRGQDRERLQQETVDHELAMSLQGDEYKSGGGGDKWDEAGPSAFPILAQQPAGFLQDDHQMQHEWSRPFEDIQPEMAASQQEFQPFHQFPLQYLDEEQLEFQNHHRRLSQTQDFQHQHQSQRREQNEAQLEFLRVLFQMGRRENFNRIPSMLNEHGLSNVGNSYEALLELGDNLGSVTSGLSSEACSTLPTKRYTQRDRQTEGCSVCMEEYKTGDTQKTLPCLHIFHDSCIDPWLKDNATCPVCREVVKVSGF